MGLKTHRLNLTLILSNTRDDQEALTAPGQNTEEWCESSWFGGEMGRREVACLC